MTEGLTTENTEITEEMNLKLITCNLELAISDIFGSASEMTNDK